MQNEEERKKKSGMRVNSAAAVAKTRKKLKKIRKKYLDINCDDIIRQRGAQN